MKTNRLFSVRNLVLMAILAAIGVVLKAYFSFMVFDNQVRLGFGDLPTFFAGMVLGPVAGGIVGIVNDILSLLLSPKGVFFPGFTLSSALRGIIPGLVVLLLKDKRSVWTISVASFLVYVIVALGLDTLWLNILYGKGFFAILPIRAAAHAIMMVLTIFITKILIRATDGLDKEKTKT